ncbi:MAG: hypothetical protein NTZ07_00430, partial [Candidatus Woesebacteria bacterium]|nr:hypothetical protein [Candidatus Woesebacteria bacterium]
MKKLLLSFLAGLIILFSFAPYLSPAKAQTWYSQNPFEWYLKVYDTNTSPANEIFGERYTAAQVQWVIWSFLFMPVRMVETVVGENTISCFMKGFGTGTIDLNNCGGAVIDLVKRMTDKIFPNPISYNNKPFIALVFDSSGRGVSGIGYTKDLLKKFSLVSEVKAQSIGYTGLGWIQKYWKGFRDISYTLLVLVIIVFAFMIMFRVKLSPQTVISVQSALPKVIVAMVLITFSYAIAGFAIDLMYVVSGLFALLLNYAGFSHNINNAFATIAGTGLGYEIFGGFWVFFMMLAYTVMFFISAVVSLLTTFAAGVDLFGMILALVFVLIAVWVLVLCIWYTFKIPYVLIKTLVSVYISIITAPVQILAGTIAPSMGFGVWFKRLMADILVFPVVGLLFWFAWATLWTSYGQAFKDVTSYWVNFGTINWIPGIIGTKGLGQPS